MNPLAYFAAAGLVLIVMFSVATLRSVSRSNALVAKAMAEFASTNAAAMTEFASAMKELHRQLNSRLDALVDLTGVYQRSLGVAEGIRQQKAMDEKAK